MDGINELEILRPAAEEILATLKTIGERVQAELGGSPLTSAALANQNQEVIRRAMAQLVTRAAQRASELHRLKDEPAIARVVTRNGKGQQRTYYICRGMPPSGTGVDLASQRAPIGRLAALLPGDDVELDRVGWLEVLETEQLHPRRDRSGWDSAPTVFRAESFDARTAKSLRELLAAFLPSDEQDLMSQRKARRELKSWRRASDALSSGRWPCGINLFWTASKTKSFGCLWSLGSLCWDHLEREKRRR